MLTTAGECFKNHDVRHYQRDTKESNCCALANHVRPNGSADPINENLMKLLLIAANIAYLSQLKM
jgi:hypothetical protein